MSGDPIGRLTDLYKAGDTDMERLKRATERNAIAQLVRSLRRWHKELQEATREYSPSLAAALWKMNPRSKEYARVAGTYSSFAQRLLLMTTATALYRLAPHLADAKPKRKTGPKKKNLNKHIAEAKVLRNSGAATSNYEAARMIVKALGKADCQSEKSAIDIIRKSISDKPDVAS